TRLFSHPDGRKPRPASDPADKPPRLGPWRALRCSLAVCSDAADEAFLDGAGHVPAVGGEEPPGGEPAGSERRRAPAVVEEPLVGPERAVEPQRVVEAGPAPAARAPGLAVGR